MRFITFGCRDRVRALYVTLGIKNIVYAIQASSFVRGHAWRKVAKLKLFVIIMFVSYVSDSVAGVRTPRLLNCLGSVSGFIC